MNDNVSNPTPTASELFALLHYRILEHKMLKVLGEVREQPKSDELEEV